MPSEIGAQVFARSPWIALMAVGAVLVGCSSDAFPVGAVLFPTPTTSILVVVDGPGPEEPSSSLSLVGVGGEAVGSIALPAASIVRVRSTSSVDHVIVLSRDDAGGSGTGVAVASVTTRSVSEVDVPESDWDVIPVAGGPSSLAVIADSAGTLVAINLISLSTTNLATTLVSAVPLASSSPDGSHMAVQGDDELVIIDATRLTDKEYPGHTFVRWTGNGATFEATTLDDDGQQVLRAYGVDGTPGPTSVRFGIPRASVATDVGLLTLHERVVGIVTTAGGQILHEGEGPFTEPLGMNTTTGLVVVFDGSGSGATTLAVDAGAHVIRELEVPLGVSPIRLRSDGPVPPWLLDTRTGQLIRVDLTTRKAEVVGIVEDTQLPEPSEFLPAAESILVLRRTGGSVLERRGTIFRASGPLDVWLGTNPVVAMSAAYTHVALAGGVDGTNTVTMIDLETGTVVTEREGHSPTWIDVRSS